MEASTLQPPATLRRPRITVGAPLLRLRSDDQLLALFRSGHDEAFRAIHDRYHKRLFAYARQMLPGRQDAEDALQDVFVRAYAGLRASDRELALRPWLFRVAHNRCIDQLRKPNTPPPELLQLARSPVHDPLAEIDLRESLRRLVDDIRRLPDQQRSALLMRELAGMSYAELASSLGVSVGAVKSLLVRARLALAQASEARETTCAVIREQLVEAHDRGVRPTPTARRHMRDCSCCKRFRHELRGVSRQLAAVAPTVGPLGALAKLVGFSGGGAAGGTGGGTLLGGGTVTSAGGLAFGTSHVATVIVAAVATAGGAVEIQRSILPPPRHASRAHAASHKPGRAAAQLLTSPSGTTEAVSLPVPAALAVDYPEAVAGRKSSPAVPVKRSMRARRKAASKRSSLAGSAGAGVVIVESPPSTGCATSSAASPAADGSASPVTAAPTTPSPAGASSTTTAAAATSPTPAAGCDPSGGSSTGAATASSATPSGGDDPAAPGASSAQTGTATTPSAATSAGSSTSGSNTTSG